MGDRLEYILFAGFSRFFKIIGLKATRKFATVLAFAFYYLIPIRKETVLDNLKHAFPEYSDKKIKKIAFGSYKSFAISLVEILYVPYLSAEELKKIIIITNLDFLREKVKENKGFILLSAHFGNWEYLAMATGVYLEAKLAIVVKPQRNKFVTDWMNKARSKWGNKVTPLGISIRNVYQELKEKRTVAMVADQRGPEDGIRINFFGRQASIYSGPAILSIKLGSPIVYTLAIRQPDYTYKAEFIEIGMENLPEDNDEKVKALSQRYNDYLENMIRKYPEQWLWMHKRWKY